MKEFNELDGEIADKLIEKKNSPKETFYYHIRATYNKLSADEKKSPFGSALFIFLNKTGFRGLFRVSKNGFNVPYGHYKNPEIINKTHLDVVHELIQSVSFECADFEVSLGSAKDGDYIYLDPPYAPEVDILNEKNKKSFVGYTEDGFNIAKHSRLFEMVRELSAMNVKMMMSNADVELVRDNFVDYTIETILCKRAINSKKPNAKTNEVLIKNY